MHLVIVFEVVIGLLAYSQVISLHFEVPTLLASVLGTAIAFFIGFTNNQAYDRWWEARKIWGEIVNDSRTWARTSLAYWNETSPEDREIKERLVKRHLAWLHALKNHLRGTKSTTFLLYLSESDREVISTSLHKNNTLLQLQAADIQHGLAHGKINDFQFKALDEALVRMTNQMGKCERIKNTVFPTNYIFFTKFFIFLFISINSMALYNLSGWWAILFGWIIGFVFYATYYNGLMIMNPFENEPADTPMSALTRTLERNLLEMLGEPDLPEPLQPLHDDYLM